MATTTEITNGASLRTISLERQRGRIADRCVIQLISVGKGLPVITLYESEMHRVEDSVDELSSGEWNMWLLAENTPEEVMVADQLFDEMLSEHLASGYQIPPGEARATPTIAEVLGAKKGRTQSTVMLTLIRNVLLRRTDSEGRDERWLYLGTYRGIPSDAMHLTEIRLRRDTKGYPQPRKPIETQTLMSGAGAADLERGRALFDERLAALTAEGFVEIARAEDEPTILELPLTPGWRRTVDRLWSTLRGA